MFESIFFSIMCRREIDPNKNKLLQRLSITKISYNTYINTQHTHNFRAQVKVINPNTLAKISDQTKDIFKILERKKPSDSPT